jgi:benzylsuccinate CoA-transferase BbsF subunit
MTSEGPARAVRQVLTGVRVLDLTWWAAGPIASKWLGAHGAQVIKIGSIEHLDALRGGEPRPPGVVGLNVSGFFNNFNSDKLDVSLNLSKAEGLEIIRRLIKISDVMMDNFTPHTLEHWGLTYDEVTKINPRIIMASQPMQGSAGPDRLYSGGGATIFAIAGIHGLIGWPDRAPTGSGTSFPDFTCNPHHWCFYILAALLHRQRTGVGQYIDQSQLQSTAAFIGPALMDFAVNGRVATARGNRSDDASVRGAYRCRPQPGRWAGTLRPEGDYDPESDRWIVIEVRDDDQWDALVRAMGRPEWASQDRFTTAEARQRNASEMDELLEAWTRELAADEVLQLLQANGVPAGVVQNAEDVTTRDPHLLARAHYSRLDHVEAGPHLYDGPAFKLSRTPGRVTRAAALMGEDGQYVLQELLHMSDDQIAELAAAGVLE